MLAEGKAPKTQENFGRGATKCEHVEGPAVTGKVTWEQPHAGKIRLEQGI